MALYEHIFISRQDLSNTQAEDLIKEFSNILSDNGGSVVGHEYWGLRSLAYKIKKNRKGHYAMIKSDSPPEATHEMERLMKLNEDVIRVMSIKVKVHEDGPSVMLKTKNKSEDRNYDNQEQIINEDA